MYRTELLEDPARIESLRSGMRAIRARSLIYREGESADSFETLLEGWALRFRRTLDGQRQVLGVLLPGDPLGLAGICTGRMPFSVQALTDVRLCVFPLGRLRGALLDDVSAACRLGALIGREWARSEDRLIDLGRRSATERIALFILELHARLLVRGMADEDGEFPLPIRQQDIADALGLTAIHVSRVLAELRRRALLEFGRRKVRIRNRRGLIGVAGVAEAELERIAEEEAEIPACGRAAPASAG